MLRVNVLRPRSNKCGNSPDSESLSIGSICGGFPKTPRGTTGPLRQSVEDMRRVRRQCSERDDNVELRGVSFEDGEASRGKLVP